MNTLSTARRPMHRRTLLNAAAVALGASGAGLVARRAEAGGASVVIDADNTGVDRTRLRSDFNGTTFRVENRNGSGDARNAIYAHLGGVAGADPSVPTALVGLNTINEPGATGVRGFASGVGVDGYGSGTNGVGVYGAGTLVGVHGSVNSATGVLGTVIGSTGYGVRGIGDNAGSWGVRAEGGSGGQGLSVIGSGGIPGVTGGMALPVGPAMLVEGSAVFDGPIGFTSLRRAYIEAGQIMVRVKDSKIAGPRGRADVLVTLQSSPGAGIAVSCVVKGKGFYDVYLTKAALSRTAVACFVAHRA